MLDHRSLFRLGELLRRTGEKFLRPLRTFQLFYRPQKTTRLEQFLLLVIVLLLPLEDYLPNLAGVAPLYLWFAVLAGYALLHRPAAVLAVSAHPVFRSAYLFLLVATIIESWHPRTSYLEILRIGHMIGGAVVVASLCRDRKALLTVFYSYLAAGLYVSIFLVSVSYRTLLKFSPTDYAEASLIREVVFGALLGEGDLNVLGFIAVQGLLIALVFALTAKRHLHACSFAGAGLVVLLGTLLTMSRGAMANGIVSSVVLLYAAGRRGVRTFIVTGVLALGILTLVPGVVFSRLTFLPQDIEGQVEIRGRLLMRSLERAPQYLIAGIGSGNFWEEWALENKFGEHGEISGAHNGFIQVTIYWGLAGLLCLATICWQAFRCLVRPFSQDVLTLGLLGVALSSLLFLVVVDTLYSKYFSMSLGLLVAAQYWVWSPTAAKSETNRPRTFSGHP